MADALENNYKAVRILGANVEKLENRLSEALPRLDGAVSSLREAGRITVSGEARRTLEREGDAICRKIAGRIDRESAKMLDRLSMRDRVTISDTAFWCLIEAVIFLLAAFICTAWPTPVHAQCHAVEDARRHGRVSCTLHRTDCFRLP